MVEFEHNTFIKRTTKKKHLKIILGIHLDNPIDTFLSPSEALLITNIENFFRQCNWKGEVQQASNQLVLQGYELLKTTLNIEMFSLKQFWETSH